MLVLVKEQSSIYAFSWTSSAKTFDGWNKASEETVKSLKINIIDSNVASIGKF